VAPLIGGSVGAFLYRVVRGVDEVAEVALGEPAG